MEDDRTNETKETSVRLNESRESLTVTVIDTTTYSDEDGDRIEKEIDSAYYYSNRWDLENPRDNDRRGLAIPMVPSASSINTDLDIHEHSEPVNWKTVTIKLLAILVLLYFFVCSLGFLSDAFRLIAGKAAGELLQQDKLISNPIVGVMTGILVTVALQSSSTSTSIIVSMVASGLFPVRTAIPFVMGANLGTSVTNTIVALTHISNKVDFERAFGGAVLHDMFNLLAVSVMLPLELLTRFLEVVSGALTNRIDTSSTSGGEIQVLSVLTKPFTSLIIQVNKDVIIGWSIKDPNYDDARLLKVWCNVSRVDTEEKMPKKCSFLFNLFDFGDWTIGLILLLISLAMLIGCLICIVKVLSSLLKGKVALAVQKVVNANIPYVPFLTGYFAMGVGAILTVLVQSSSVFTSSLTPLIALGHITLERAYPLTLGSNVGSTTTAMLAALSTEGPNLKYSIQLALCHLLFNCTGILLFYPIPFMRFPIPMAAELGRITAKYRWFAIAYLISMFLLLPLFVFTLSLLGALAFYTFTTFIFIIILLVVIRNTINRYWPEFLPEKYRSWDFLPIWFHSLEPYDNLVNQITNWCRYTCCNQPAAEHGETQRLKSNSTHNSTGGLHNLAFRSMLEHEKVNLVAVNQQVSSM